eukprot:Hpha_TRINITY_DN15687_c1_g1::TRINITY_DN15687_c1_g1_i1::g.99061::m.99061/K03514/PAPD5_7, TRF4; non-canonical poly(A) RNA polymerase PAPD5/7
MDAAFFPRRGGEQCLRGSHRVQKERWCEGGEMRSGVPPTAQRPASLTRGEPRLEGYIGPPTAQHPPPPPPPGPSSSVGRDSQGSSLGRGEPAWNGRQSVGRAPSPPPPPPPPLQRISSPTQDSDSGMSLKLNPQATAFVPRNESRSTGINMMSQLAGAAGLNPKAASFTPSASPPTVGSPDPGMEVIGNICSFPASPIDSPAAAPAQLSPVRDSPSEESLPEANHDGKVLVCTPWLPNGVEKSTIELGAEMLAFAKLMRLTPSERQRREQLCVSLTAAAQQQWPSSSISTYGSFAVGLSAPFSAVDICVERCGPIRGTAEICRAFSAFGLIKSVLSESEDGGFCQVEVNGVLANVSLHRGVGTLAAAESVNIVRSWVVGCTALAPVHCLLRQVLSQTGNLDVCSGGISSHALLAMVVAIAATRTDTEDPAGLMMDFCSVFGTTFDFAANSVSTDGTTPPKAHPGEQLSVLDPLDSGNNLAQGCTRLFQIRVQLQHCHATLLRWEGGAAAKGRKGYKGRTPLSGIISHQKLWSRADSTLLEKEGHHQDKISPERLSKTDDEDDCPSLPPLGPRYQYDLSELYALRDDPLSKSPPTGLRQFTEIFVASECVPAVRNGLPPRPASDGSQPFELFSVREARLLRQSSPPEDASGSRLTKPSPGRSVGCELLGLSDSEPVPSGLESRESLASGDDEQRDLFRDIDAALAVDLNV